VTQADKTQTTGLKGVVYARWKEGKEVGKKAKGKQKTGGQHHGKSVLEKPKNNLAKPRVAHRNLRRRAQRGKGGAHEKTPSFTENAVSAKGKGAIVSSLGGGGGGKRGEEKKKRKRQRESLAVSSTKPPSDITGRRRKDGLGLNTGANLTYCLFRESNIAT